MFALLTLVIFLGNVLADISRPGYTSLSPITIIFLATSNQSAAATTSSQSDFPTRTLFLPGYGASSTYYGSIMTAAPDATVYSLRCAHMLCASLSSNGIVTEGPSTFSYAFTVWNYEDTFVTMNCSLGPRDATCTSAGWWYYTTRSYSGTTPVFSFSTVLNFSDYTTNAEMGTVIVTAGADLLPTGTLTPASTPTWMPVRTTTASSSSTGPRMKRGGIILMMFWFLVYGVFEIMQFSRIV